LFYRKDAPYSNYLQIFGQLGVVKALQPTNKLSDKGLKAIFVGFADKHAGNVYRFVNPSTNRIILSRDVKWLSKRYGEEKHIKPSFVMPTGNWNTNTVKKMRNLRTQHRTTNYACSYKATNFDPYN